jgi:hypothetical protein
MHDDNFLFKSVSFLTSLIRSQRGKTYIEEGFTEKEFEKEIIVTLEEGLSLTAQESFDYEELVKNDIPFILKALQNHLLIYLKDHRYYITDEGKNISDFMVKLSNAYTFAASNSLGESKMPFRKYPNSNEYYGLN